MRRLRLSFMMLRASGYRSALWMVKAAYLSGSSRMDCFVEGRTRSLILPPFRQERGRMGRKRGGEDEQELMKSSS
jgi:hypothetical protein